MPLLAKILQTVTYVKHEMRPMNTPEKILLTQNDVCQLLTISKTTLWRIEKEDKKFPSKIFISCARVVYKKHEILDWLENK
jgi:predicted DNA-binding transcriptional regulator AlpA